MASYDIDTLHEHILQILLSVDKVCREHDLTYYCWAGTMLGAVRHKGFIPWDDDMDICMPRPDYDRLMTHAHEWLPTPLEALSIEIDASYPGGFGKIVDGSTTLIEREHSDYVGGIYIDVFPIDNVPDNQNLQSAMYKTWRKWFNIHGLKLMSTVKERTFIKNAILVFFHLVLSLVPYKYLVKKIETNAMQYSNQKTKYCGIAVWGYGKKEIKLKSNFEDVIMMPFEDITVPVPVGYDNYLTSVYGDYMMLPPAEKRTSHHDFEAWWKG